MNSKIKDLKIYLRGNANPPSSKIAIIVKVIDTNKSSFNNF